MISSATFVVVMLCVLQTPPPVRGQAPVINAAEARPTTPDYKIAFWFRRKHPLETFQYQAYDVRKGEYTKAVDDWLALMRSKYPHYEVFVRDVDLSRVKGETEPLKVGSVVQQELWAAAAREGIFRDGPPAVSSNRLPTAPAYRPSSRPSMLSPSPIGAAGFSNLGPPEPSFPVPMPYPRPHP